MSRVWFSEALETAALFCRILRRDGVTLGFTAHDRDLWLDGVLHRASPGVTASSIRKSADFEPDSAEILGAITHDALNSADLAAGRFDGAAVRIGLADWESREHTVLYAGVMGEVSEERGNFSCDLTSRKAELLRDPVPRTSPACRAAFCGPGCNLNPLHFTREALLLAADGDANTVTFAALPDPAGYTGGSLRWLDGPAAGLSALIAGVADGAALLLDRPLPPKLTAGTRVLLREGCDHTLDTCAARFGNAVNFRGEPFLPGNDLLTRYPVPSQ
jgi:phage conserved hypothetical protein BR0599